MSEMLRSDSEGVYTAFDLRICYHMFTKNQYTVYPRTSKSTNIGFDGSGLHCGISDYYIAKLDEGQDIIRFDKFMYSSFLMRYFYKCYIDRASRLMFITEPLFKQKRNLKKLIKQNLQQFHLYHNRTRKHNY